MGLIKEIRALCDKEYAELPDARHTGDLYQIGFNSAIQHMVSEIEEILSPYQFTKIRRTKMTDEEKFHEDVFKIIGRYPAKFTMTLLLYHKDNPKKQAEVKIQMHPGCRMRKKDIRDAIREALKVGELKDYRIATPQEFASYVVASKTGKNMNFNIAGIPEHWPWEELDVEGKEDA